MPGKNAEFIEKFLDNLRPKCEKCGAKLSSYAYYDERYEIRHCKHCGHTNRRERVNWR